MPSGSPPPLPTPFDDGSQIAPSRDRGDTSNRPALEDRSVSIPERKDARRVNDQGRTGSQRTIREQFNTAVCKAGGVEVMKDHPISVSKVRRICSRARGVLYNTLRVPKGRHTHDELKELVDLQQARRLLEKHFPVLSLAENQWAADGFLQETLQNDRRPRSRRSASPSDNDAKFAGPSQSSSSGDDDVDDLPHSKNESLRALTPPRKPATAPATRGGIKKKRSRKKGSF